MNINNYLLKDYIINASDILYLLKTKTIKSLINNLQDTDIKVKNEKIHTNNIKHIENFILILDQYIYFIKQNIFIDPLEMRFLIELSIDNKKSKIFTSKKYYLDHKDYYQKEFKELFSHNFYMNQKTIQKNVNNIKVINTFDGLCNLINNNKDSYFHLFEKCTEYNLISKIEIWTNLNFN